MQDLSRPFKIFLLLVLVVIVVGGVWLYVVFYGSNNFPNGNEKILYVSKGQTVTSVIDSLEALGIIRNKTWFIFIVRISGGTPKVQVGKYKFSTGISNYQLFRSLTKGENAASIAVTLPEGLTARQQAHILTHALGIDSTRFLSLVFDRHFAHSLGVESPSLEGYLFPETYAFRWQVDEKDVVSRLVSEFQSFYNDSLRERAREFGWNANQMVTFASIVEGEAVLSPERATISGVYHNRLRKGMKLEADPTVRYMLKDGPRRILYSDLRIDNPYNTYRNAGLPPGPINNPGKASILAALFPVSTTYLFFVANGSGGHWFSSTYAEHLHYVYKYRRERRLHEEGVIGARGRPGVH